MTRQFRFSLSLALLTVGVVGTALGLYLKAAWAPRYRTMELNGVLADDTRYEARLFLEVDRFKGRRLLSATVIPHRTNFGMSQGSIPQLPNSIGYSVYPNGVFYYKERIAGFGTKRVVVVLGHKDVHVIELTLDELEELDSMTDLETSKVWQEKVEPEIDRLVATRQNVHDRTYRSQRAARKAQADRANAVVQLPDESLENSSASE